MTEEERSVNHTIITLLEENRDDMKHLHNCIHETKDMVGEIKMNFIGISAEEHISHHVQLQKAIEDTRRNQYLTRRLIITAVAGVFASAFTAFIVWGYNAEIKSLKEQIRIESQSKSHEDREKH